MRSLHSYVHGAAQPLCSAKAVWGRGLMHACMLTECAAEGHAACGRARRQARKQASRRAGGR